MLSSERLESDQREIRVALNGKLQLSKGSHVRVILTFIWIINIGLDKVDRGQGSPRVEITEFWREISFFALKAKGTKVFFLQHLLRND